METQIAAFDPVSRHTVILDETPISAIYQGRAYYFERRENRDAFETNPGKYLAGSPMAGCPIGARDAPTDRPRRRGGG
jgi:YHS domain-containing protein